MQLHPKSRRSSDLRERTALRNREIRRRMRIWYAPFHGMTVFTLSLLLFTAMSQALTWLGLLGGPANYLLVPVAGIGMMSIAPLPMFEPTGSGIDLLATLLASFLCGGATHFMRPFSSTREWFFKTTALLVALGSICHYIWRKFGNDWPDWLAYVRDLV
ncbi:MAG: hypothetical protein MK209_00645 [Planctomycetes bacterium]|nr:hypothetical protein [Planctomycetota bacterium]